MPLIHEVRADGHVSVSLVCAQCGITIEDQTKDPNQCAGPNTWIAWIFINIHVKDVLGCGKLVTGCILLGNTCLMALLLERSQFLKILTDQHGLTREAQSDHAHHHHHHHHRHPSCRLERAWFFHHARTEGHHHQSLSQFRENQPHCTLPLALPFCSPSFFHTISLPPAFTSA
jgi:hypothetical protein